MRKSLWLSIFHVLLAGSAVVTCYLLNLPAFTLSEEPEKFNQIVSASYLVTWLFVYAIAFFNRSENGMAYYLIFWAITFAVTLISAFISLMGFNFSWFSIFTAVTTAQWYGFADSMGDKGQFPYAIAGISIFMVCISAYLYRWIHILNNAE